MKRTSIRLRLMALMICLTTVPVITVTWIATHNTRESVEKEIISANRSRMLWADQYLSELIQQIDTMLYSVHIQDRLAAALNDIDSPDPRIQLWIQNDIWDILTSAYRANARKVDNLTLYIHANQKAYSISYADSGTISQLDIREGPWSWMLETPIGMYFKMDGDGIYAYHSMNRFEDRSLFGGLSVRINRHVWQEVSRILQSETDSSVYLFNDQGELLSGSSPAAPTDEFLRQWKDGQPLSSELTVQRTANHVYFLKKIDDGELTVVKAIPLADIQRSARATMTAGILTGSLFAGLSVLLSIIVSLRISRPIVSLAQRMRTAHIHNFQGMPSQSRDEIGLLERGYNSMMLRIKELIEGEYQKEIEVRQAQLMALQAQINPHFLNNTLHLIGGMALTKDAPEIYRITTVIGKLLQYSISEEGDFVRLDDELKHMRNYLFIQEQRFAGRITVDLDIDESALASMLPKFTLQPVVENAFEHGLQRKEGAWRMQVRIRRTRGRIVVLVKDEGVGMTEERLRRLREELSGQQREEESQLLRNPVPAKRRRGIGLRNVNARLQLQFGGSYGIRLFSKSGIGTLAAIVWPARDKEMREDA